MRECIYYIKENDGKWGKRTREETERINGEERKERLAIAAKKKKKFEKNKGSPQNKELTRLGTM